MKYTPKNFWFIHVDGTDCSGKTTFIKEFNKATNYSTWIIDRSTISVRAYAKKFNRSIPDPLLLENYISGYKYSVYVRLIANEDDVVRRQNIKNDGYNSSDYQEDMKLFNDEENDSGFSAIIQLNSSEMTIEEEIQILIDYMKEVENGRK